MRSLINYILYSQATLVCISLGLGYGIWSTLNQTIQTNTTISIPITIQNSTKNLWGETLKTIPLTLQGTQFHLHTIKDCKCSISIDISSLLPGAYFIALSETNITLPPSISVVNYSTIRIPVIVKEMI